MIMSTGDHRRKVMLKLYEKLGPNKASALINWHAPTGCDTTGHIQGEGNKGCFKAFLEADPTVLDALTRLGQGADLLPEVIKGCEEFLCSLFCPKQLKISTANNLRWHLFKHLKDNQGVNKLPPTPGA